MGYYLLRCSLLLGIGLLIYAQTFGFGFVFDDHLFIVTNPFIKNFQNIHVMWQAFPRTRLIGMYSFALNYHFNQLNASGYHIFNFIVHLIAVGLAWALADLLFRMAKILPAKDKLVKEFPFVIALLFLVHPGQTQAVTYISQRFESLATVFYLSTIYAYFRGRLSKDGKRVMWWALSGFALVLGMLTKETIITAPLMILTGEWILFGSKSFKKGFTVFAVGGLLLYLVFSRLVQANISVFWQSVASDSHDGDFITPLMYWLTEARVFLTYLRLLMWPAHQTVDYDYPASTGLFSPPLTVVGIAAVIAFVILIVKLRKEFPLVSFGLAWMVIAFSINLVPRANVIFEHKLYLISFGFFLAVVAFLFGKMKDRWLAVKFLVVAIVLLGATAYARNKVWVSELALWQDNIKTAPNKARVNASLGRVYGSAGQYAQGVYYLSRALAIKPDNISYENRGILYSLQGKTDEALKDLDQSISMDRDYFPTYLKRAWIFQGQHQYRRALEDLAYAMELNPYYPDTYIERGMVWIGMGRYTEALADFQQALKIDPFNAQAAQDRTYCLGKMGSS